MKITKSRSVYFALIFIVLLFNYKYFYPLHCGPVTDSQKFSGESWRLLTTASIYDYLPKTAQTAAKAPAKLIIDRINPVVDYQISGYKSGTNWSFFNIDLNNNTRVTLARLYFPIFKLYDRGKEIKYLIDPYLGRVEFDLSAGSHQIYFKITNTPIRSVSNYLSLFFWIFFIWKILILKKSK